MLYMIIEEFHRDRVKQLYKRFEEKGRQLPEGVRYINSWVTEDVTICYQIMESDTEYFHARITLKIPVDSTMDWLCRF